MGEDFQREPVVAVVIDGEVLSWRAGRLNGPSEHRGQALVAGLSGEPVALTVHGPVVTAGLDGGDLVGVAGALVAASPGRARLVRAPQVVWDAVKAASPDLVVDGAPTAGVDGDFVVDGEGGVA